MEHSCRLLVRKFPKWLRSEDKESLLRYFGATDVAVMSPRGKMKHCAFATFFCHEDAKIAITKLHQLDLFGCRLVVEYASPKTAPHESVEDRWQCDVVRGKETLMADDKESQPLHTNVPPFAPAPLLPAPNCHLLYSYPPPNQTILTNIAHTLACVPELYVQVLHLMNKMNLPPPFGPLTPSPSLQPGAEHGDRGERTGEEEESEMESGGEEDLLKRQQHEAVGVGVKRRKMSFHHVKDLPAAKVLKTGHLQEDESKRIAIKAPTAFPSTDQLTAEEHIPESVFTIGSVSTLTPAVVPSTTTPDLSPPTSEHSNEVSAGDTGETFITSAEILAKKISAEELCESSLYNNYSPGEPSMRLYIKNLGKQVVEKDLRFIFGRYVSWTLEVERDRFDIRLMQQGRMKGQAFIGLPSEEAAVRAVEETNGYTLHGRPMVVQFARSIKSKEQVKPS